MEDDEIMADIWAYREAWAARFGGDLTAMMRDLQERERRSDRIILEPRPRAVGGEFEAESPDRPVPHESVA